jgi:hypothetical protein
MLRVPLRCTNEDSWHGHIPFAFWCVEALEPRLIVELGCHGGDSYCAFCQAVEEVSADASCYAVGTWSDDPRAGSSAPEIYEELRRYHDPLYGRFSSLVRSASDEALSRFDDASIDLLHIHGSRGDDEARHEVSTWLSKLSSAGVVLLDGIAVREAGLGVWRLWEELRHAYPSFSFPHSSGLGILAVGAGPPAALRRLTSLDHQSAEDVRQLFCRLGDAVRLHRTQQALAGQQVRVTELGALLAERERQIATLTEERDTLFRSTSWRVAAPLRLAGRLLRRLRRDSDPAKSDSAQ